MHPAGAPWYLTKYYWWAYQHPRAVWFFDRWWVINTILFGNYWRLRNAALRAFGGRLSGRTLQVSCCYGSLTPMLLERIVKSGGSLDIVDALQIQLDNVKRKVLRDAPIRYLRMDAAALDLPDAAYDRALVFFLLHEVPQDVRENIVRGVLRSVKPNGSVIIVDYGRASKWNPLRYLVLPWLGILEPFALPLWNADLRDVVPQLAEHEWQETSYFGGLYQMLVRTPANAAGESSHDPR